MTKHDLEHRYAELHNHLCEAKKYIEGSGTAALRVHDNIDKANAILSVLADDAMVDLIKEC